MPEQDEILPLPAKNAAVTEFLTSRRSNLAKSMGEPGPSPQQLSELLTIAARVPDHRKLTPWRFVIFEGHARADFGQHIASAFMKQNPEAPLDRSVFEGQRFLRAPTIVAVISTPKDCPRGTPEWEQHLSSGVVCYNLCLAAQAAGFGAQWLTEWYAYNAEVGAALGLSGAEKVAGFVYIGTPDMPPTERLRPDLALLTQHWSSK